MSIDPKQWEERRQAILAGLPSDKRVLMIYNPHTGRTLEMHIEQNFAELTDSFKWEAYMRPALQALEYLP